MLERFSSKDCLQKITSNLTNNLSKMSTSLLFFMVDLGIPHESTHFLHKSTHDSYQLGVCINQKLDSLD